MRKFGNLVISAIRMSIHYCFSLVRLVFSKGRSFLANCLVFTRPFFSVKTLNLIVALVALYVGYQSLRLSQMAIEQADVQFRNNSYAEKLQMKRSQAQFDSVMQILNNYQKISKQALIASKRQATTAKRMLDDQIYSARPYITVDHVEIDDKNKTFFEASAPRLTIFIHNAGKRTGEKIVYEVAVVDLKTKFAKLKIEDPVASLPGGFTTPIEYLPKIPKDIINDFYLYFQVKYYDEILMKTFDKEHFLRYFKIRENEDFRVCSKNEVEQIKKIIASQRHKS